MHAKWLVAGVLCVGMQAWGADKDPTATLSCYGDDSEAVLLGKNNTLARRLSEHTLALFVGGQWQRYEDQPPHEGPGGVHWRFCGYDPVSHQFLVERREETEVAGRLISQDKGSALDAGHTVLFAPDRRRYLAITQAAEADGAGWAIYDRQGRKQWSGTDLLIGDAATSGPAGEMRQPRWIHAGLLVTSLRCLNKDATVDAKLIRDSAGWHWDGTSVCLEP